MGKDSFVFYRSFYESIKNLDKEIQLEIYNAICNYSLNDEQMELSPIANAIFTLIKPNIDSATKRYNASVENGKKGGRPKKKENLEKPSQNLNETQQKPDENLNEDVDDNVDVDVNVNVDGDEDNIDISSPPPKKEDEILKEEFEKLWKMYPKKVGKDKAYAKYKKFRTSKKLDEYCTYEDVLKGIERYLKYIKATSWYSPKDGSTWFNNRCWNDEYSVKEESVPEWLENEIKKEVLSKQERDEIEELLTEYR